jgi:hypothetical protein
MRNYKIENDFMLDDYRCVVVGQSMGHRCGYIGIPKGHSVYGKDYDEIDIDVHGGLTYAGDDNYPVESDLWWIGFDCAHSGDGKDFELIKELADTREYDIMLQMERMFPMREYETVRTKEYVEEQLIYVVNQLKNMQ